MSALFAVITDSTTNEIKNVVLAEEFEDKTEATHQLQEQSTRVDLVKVDLSAKQFSNGKECDRTLHEVFEALLELENAVGTLSVQDLFAKLVAEGMKAERRQAQKRSIR
jgi:hypothetical protein